MAVLNVVSRSSQTKLVGCLQRLHSTDNVVVQWLMTQLEIPFGLWARMSCRNDVLDGGPA